MLKIATNIVLLIFCTFFITMDYAKAEKCNYSMSAQFDICDTASNCAPVSESCEVNASGHTLSDDVEWPCDLDLYTCASFYQLDPPSLLVYPGDSHNDSIFVSLNAWPTDNDGVGLQTYDPSLKIDVCYEDDYSQFDMEACRVIKRKWMIDDRNTYGWGISGGYWEYTQTIRLFDIQAPELTDVEIVEHCEILNEDCWTWMMITASGYDSCGQNNVWYEYELDLWQDDEIDQTGKSKSLSAFLPPGDHQIYWRVKDKCGNMSEWELFEFTIEGECIKPTPVCAHGISTSLMPSMCMMMIDASLLNLSSFDNCTAQEDLVYKIKLLGSLDPPEEILNLDCSFITDGISGTVDVEVWVYDEAGNSDYCETYIIIQDNPFEGNPEGCCPDCVPCTDSIDVIIACPTLIDSPDCVPDPNEPCNFLASFTEIEVADCFNITEQRWEIDLDNQDPDNFNVDLFGFGNSSGYYPAGEHLLKTIITSSCEDTATCYTPFSILDCIFPIIQCQTEDIQVAIGPEGLVIINEDEILESVTDACGEVTLCLKLNDEDPCGPVTIDCSFFDQCDSLATVILTLCATDEAGNTACCEAEVTITDYEGFCIEPFAVECKPEEETIIMLDSTGVAYLYPDQLVQNVSGNCGDFEVCISYLDSLGMPVASCDSLMFTCDFLEEGQLRIEIEVEVCVTEENGETDCCITTFLLEDPGAYCKDCTNILGITTGGDIWAINSETGEVAFVRNIPSVSGANALSVNTKKGIGYFGSEQSVTWFDPNGTDFMDMGPLDIIGLVTNGGASFYNDHIYLGAEYQSTGDVSFIYKVPVTEDGKNYAGPAENLSNGLFQNLNFGDIIARDNGLGGVELIICAIDLDQAINYIISFDPATSDTTLLHTITSSNSTIQLAQDFDGDIIFYNNGFSILEYFDLATGTQTFLSDPTPTFTDLAGTLCVDSAFVSNIISDVNVLPKNDFTCLISPNPFEDKIRFEFQLPNRDVIDIQIYQPSGKLVYHDSYESMKGDNVLSIPNVSQWSNGIYFAKISHSGGSYVKTLVKQ